MYIDPNTGGMLFQILATFLALFSGFALLFSSKIRAYVARIRRSRRGEDLDEMPSEDQDVTPPEDQSGE